MLLFFGGFLGKKAEIFLAEYWMMQPHTWMMGSSSLWLPDFGSISLMAQLLPAWHRGWPGSLERCTERFSGTPGPTHCTAALLWGWVKPCWRWHRPCTHAGYLCSHIWHKTLVSAGSVHTHTEMGTLQDSPLPPCSGDIPGHTSSPEEALQVKQQQSHCCPPSEQATSCHSRHLTSCDQSLFQE